MRYRMRLNRRRTGFTIVELLVAMALTIFIMAILSEAFVVGLTAFRQLKAIGDMNEQLRTVSTVLRRDLASPHFEGERRLSDISPGGMTMGCFQYGEGYFLNPSGLPAFAEGTDSYGSSLARDADDWLMLAVRLRGNRPEEIFRGRVPAGSPLDTLALYDSRFDVGAEQTYTSQWAIVTYFLRIDPSGMTTATEGAIDQATGLPLPGLPLYHLHRRQLLLVPEAHAIGTTGTTGVTQVQTPPIVTVADLLAHQLSSDVWCYAASGVPPVGRFCTPGDVQFPTGPKVILPVPPYPAQPTYQWDRGRRPSPNTAPVAPGPSVTPAFLSFPTTGDVDASRLGADLLTTDVLSFDIQIYDPPNAADGWAGGFVDLGFGTGTGLGTWIPTPQPAVGPGAPARTSPRWRPFGRPPLRLDWPGSPVALPTPRYHASQRLYNNAWVYDSWTRRIGGGPTVWDFHNQGVQQEPYPAPVQAIKITIRVWDRKTNQTRQVTLIQDM